MGGRLQHRLAGTEAPRETDVAEPGTEGRTVGRWQGSADGGCPEAGPVSPMVPSGPGAACGRLGVISRLYRVDGSPWPFQISVRGREKWVAVLAGPRTPAPAP